ncbi:hypothetical protein X927_02885 [Petrotoga mexicana DSM 14811]|uniref:HEAT repeat domain-containing protein n=1 Tax=Petrotoga mexicana DSM 14811 TaxID=1122954 RepID=A0A2K1PCU4_9BACT|nr:HEAT repeat domain-containing protein [Petrotoga mexicana]PNS00487.1 hypothetical protein X927_02885 [Petrotoga mexicana DSM 14811]
MANEIIETYKILEERIKSENIQIYFDMLDSPYPSFKSKAIQELTKQKIDAPRIKEYLKDPDKNVRFSAYRYLDKMGFLDENTIKEALKDISANIRKEAIISYIQMGIKPIEFILEFTEDPDPMVRYQLISTFLEFYPEDSEKIISKMKNDPYVKIKQLISALENISETLKSEQVDKSVKVMALRRFYEREDAYTFFNSLKETYFDCNNETKGIIIKFFSGLPCEVINKFIEKIVQEEKDIHILQLAANTSKKVCGIDSIPTWLIDQLVNSEEAKIVKFGLKLATEKEDMSYVDFCRDLLSAVDDDLVIGASDYLIYFQDYMLKDYVPNFLNSLSSKRIREGLKIIRKLKLDNFIEDISLIALNKMYPISLRKAAVNLLKFFKAKDYWEIPNQILKDPYENGNLKLAALNALLRLNAEMVVNF